MVLIMKPSYIILKYEKLVKGNFKTLYICACFFILWCWYIQVLFLLKFCWFKFLNGHGNKNFETAISQYIKKETFKAEID